MPLDHAAPHETDIAVIGAGPAGLAAAAFAAEAGANVVLLDEQMEAGGQIYRGVGSASEARLRLMGADYRGGKALLAPLASDRIRHICDATVWEVTREKSISYSVGGMAHQMTARRIIVATGATERPMPFPGWTLPGVLTAGAGQVLLKTAGLLPPQPVVLCGSGPLLYLVGVQLLAAGQTVAALVDTTPNGNLRRALPYLLGGFRGHPTLRKGLGLLWRLRRSGLPLFRAATALHAVGAERIEALSFTAGGREHQIECATLLIHTGVVPNVQISRSLDLDHDWDDLQGCWRPRVDLMGRSSVADIFVAGDGAGIAGAEAAVPSGRLAAMAALEGLPGVRQGLERQTTQERKALERHRGVRPFLDALFAPATDFLEPPDATIVCRCEEVTAGQIRGFVDLGCLGPNQAKSYGRCGMGPCQGRYCGLTVSNLIAAERGVPTSDVGYFRLRPPLKPITIGELASMDRSVDSGETDHDQAPAA